MTTEPTDREKKAAQDQAIGERLAERLHLEQFANPATIKITDPWYAEQQRLGELLVQTLKAGSKPVTLTTPTADDKDSHDQ